jgi:hypothetical protein
LALRIDKGSDKIKMRNQILTVDLALVKPHWQIFSLDLKLKETWLCIISSNN